MGIIFLAGCSGLQFPAADASQAETSAEYAWETSKLKDDPIWADPQSVKAMIISDLHYTEIPCSCRALLWQERSRTRSRQK